jgi:hypothetical protein
MASVRRLHLLLEGQTEETIVRDILAPYLAESGWEISSSIIKTKRPVVGPAHRGGVSCWAHVNRDIRLLLQDSSITVLTTLIDYYAFPADSPGMSDRPNGDAVVRVTHVEQALKAEIGDTRFLPHLVLHEIEAWVFAAAIQLGDCYLDHGLAARLKRDVDQAGGPELVNDDPTTAPSKRLLRYRPDYTKTLDGPLAIAELGVPKLRAQCPHLDSWLAELERASSG